MELGLAQVRLIREFAGIFSPEAVRDSAARWADAPIQAHVPLTTEVVEAADVVITMGCGDACPIFPGKRYLDWELPDPAGKSVEVVRPIRDEIDQLIQALLAASTCPRSSRSLSLPNGSLESVFARSLKLKGAS